MNKVVGSIFEFIYPSNLYCISCDKLIDKSSTYSLCSHCLEHIRWQNSSMQMGSQCDSPIEEIIQTLKKTDIEYIRDVYVCTQYGLYEQGLIFSLKYDGHTYIAPYLSEMLADKLKYEGVTYDYVLDVPLNIKKYKSRGFNQSELIAKYLCENMSEYGFVHLRQGLKRNKKTHPMRGLTKIQREENVKDVFDVSPHVVEIIRNKDILLIDDILTTGSTVNECARVLMLAGAKTVDILVFASGNTDFIEIDKCNFDE